MRLPRLALAFLAVHFLPISSGCKPGEADEGDDEIVAQPVEVDQFAAEAAATVCAQLFACNCGDSPGTDVIDPLPWADEAACVATKQPEFQELLDELLASGGTFSPECGGEYIASFERLRCDKYVDYVAAGGTPFDAWHCPLVVHERSVGFECTVNYTGLLNDCGVGKLCGAESYTCVEIDDVPVAEGRPCEVEYIELPCAEGLECDYVDGQAICVAALELGDPCPDYDCNSSELLCSYDTQTCVPPAGVGESCEVLQCGAGLYCDGGKGFTCQEKFGYGEGCASSNVCAQGGICNNNICLPPPPAICSELF